MPERNDNLEILDKIGIGVDIESIDRIARFDADHVGRFLEKVFSEQEICDLRESGKDREQNYVARFSAKESIIKALSSIGIKHVAYHDILIRDEVDGTPRVKMQNPKYKEIDVKLSMSHSAGMAVSFAIAIRGSLEC